MDHEEEEEEEDDDDEKEEEKKKKKNRRKKKKYQIQSTNMRFLRSVAGYNGEDKIIN